MAQIDEFAAEHGTRDVFLGHTADDQYLVHGMYFGPGVVNVPNNIADQLEVAVARVQLTRDPKLRIDPKKTGTPPKISVEEATDAQLQAILAERARQREADGTINALRPEEQTGMNAEELKKHDAEQAKLLADTQAAAAKDQAAAQAAADKDAAARAKEDQKLKDQVAAGTPAPPAPPASGSALPPPK